jgi:hypothetical protein
MTKAITDAHIEEMEDDFQGALFKEAALRKLNHSAPSLALQAELSEARVATKQARLALKAAKAERDGGDQSE